MILVLYKFCCKAFGFGNMGIAALESQPKDDQHKMKLSSSGPVKIQQLYKATNQSGGKGTLKSFVVSSTVIAAKMKCALKFVTSHFLSGSCLNIKELFHNMFSDSHNMKLFKLSQNKCEYLIIFGIAPYFKEVLRKKILNGPVFSLLFDESMNHILMNSYIFI